MKLLLSVIGLALATLRENKIRSFLTVLGVIIGTGTIIGSARSWPGLDGAVTGVDPQLGHQHGDRFQNEDGPELRRAHGGGAQSQAADVRKRGGDRRTLPFGGAREPVSVADANGFSRPRALQGQRLSEPADWSAPTKVTLNSGQAEMKFGRFFTDTEERASHAGGGDRRGCLQAALFGTEDAIGKNIAGGRRTSWK